MISENNKRIAKNTLFLYFRMLLIMGISVFTVRIVLETLGTVDYGIYNVVGGIVVMFAFLSNTLASASQRFFSYELGKNNLSMLQKTFSISVYAYAIIILILIILSETIGLWFLNNKMVIPADRMYAVRWVYQMSIASFIITMLAIPYDALIIARERMNVYAYVSIAEAISKLIIVYLLVLFKFDKLILYSVLNLLITCTTSFIYYIYCRNQFKESKLILFWDKKLFLNLINYSGWNIIGASAAIFKNQGINILLNMFFGPAINAARAIAFQLSASINQFVMNFTMAVKPQIIKYYAQDEKEKMIKLVFQSSKLSFFLLFILAIPLLIETKYILNLWLKTPPEMAVLFTRLIIINILIDSFTYSLTTAALSTGKIRNFQLIVGGLMMLNIPISYLFLKLGYSAETAFIIGIIISATNLISRSILLRKMIKFPTSQFLLTVVFRYLVIGAITIAAGFAIVIDTQNEFLRLLLISSIDAILFITLIVLVGLDKEEKKIVRFYTNTFLKKLKLPGNILKLNQQQ